MEGLFWWFWGRECGEVEEERETERSTGCIVNGEGTGGGGAALGSQSSLTILSGEQEGDLHNTPVFGPLVAGS